MKVLAAGFIMGAIISVGLFLLWSVIEVVLYGVVVVGLSVLTSCVWEWAQDTLVNWWVRRER
jgi:hypothetical protein